MGQMNRYLLIESRDPYESGDAADFCDLALELKRAGHEVEMFLVENGVLPARRGARRTALDQVAAAGIGVAADEFSLRERGIVAAALAQAVRPEPIDLVIDRMEAGWSPVWH